MGKRIYTYRVYFRDLGTLPPSDPEMAEEARWIHLAPTKPGYTPDNPTIPFPIDVRLGVAPDGKMICTGLRIGAWDESVEIKASGLRHVPLTQILGDIATLRRIVPRKSASGGVADPAAEVHARAKEVAPTRARPGRRGHPIEFYEGIAALYREAIANSPGRVYAYMVAHVRDSEGRLLYGETDRPDIQRSREATVRKQVGKARRRGLLGPASLGVAGEAAEREATEENR
jgi:hypothetical protein